MIKKYVLFDMIKKYVIFDNYWLSCNFYTDTFSLISYVIQVYMAVIAWIEAD